MKEQCFLFLVALIVLTSCVSTHGVFENKHGKYQYQIVKSFKKNQPVIWGHIYDYDLKTPTGLSAIVLDGDSLKRWTKLGLFTFKISPGTHYFTAFGFPYDKLTTKDIKLRTGDTLKLAIYLQPDPTPIP